MKKQTAEQVIAQIKELCSKSVTLTDKRIAYLTSDNFCAADDGNYDDTFQDGVSLGETVLAKEILEIIEADEQTSLKSDAPFDETFWELNGGTKPFEQQ